LQRIASRCIARILLNAYTDAILDHYRLNHAYREYAYNGVEAYQALRAQSCIFKILMYLTTLAGLAHHFKPHVDR
jgi:hypothetical protein